MKKDDKRLSADTDRAVYTPNTQDIEVARVHRVADRIAFLDHHWPDWKEDQFTQRYVDMKDAFDAGWKARHENTRASLSTNEPQTVKEPRK